MKRLNEEFYTNGNFEVDVNSEKYKEYGYMQEEMFHLGRGVRRVLPDSLYEISYRPKHDGLFWYLLISNVVMLILIVLLVGKAVINMYW